MTTNTETPDKEKRQQALERAISPIEKQFGKGTIMKLGGETKLDVPVISTGALSLNIALGVGGIPRGRVIEIFGQESSGKTRLCLQIVSNAQQKGGVWRVHDVAHRLDA